MGSKLHKFKGVSAVTGILLFGMAALGAGPELPDDAPAPSPADRIRYRENEAREDAIKEGRLPEKDRGNNRHRVLGSDRSTLKKGEEARAPISESTHWRLQGETPFSNLKSDLGESHELDFFNELEAIAKAPPRIRSADLKSICLSKTDCEASCKVLYKQGFDESFRQGRAVKGLNILAPPEGKDHGYCQGLKWHSPEWECCRQGTRDAFQTFQKIKSKPKYKPLPICDDDNNLGYGHGWAACFKKNGLDCDQKARSNPPQTRVCYSMGYMEGIWDCQNLHKPSHRETNPAKNGQLDSQCPPAAIAPDTEKGASNPDSVPTSNHLKTNSGSAK